MLSFFLDSFLNALLALLKLLKLEAGCFLFPVCLIFVPVSI